MPKILRTEAISLHSVAYAESSKIVTFFTRDFGKLNFLAKGARRPNSKFGAALETFTHAKLIIYKPETPKLYILSDAEIIHPFSELQSSTERYWTGAQIIEFVLAAVDFDEPNARLFNLILSALMVLSDQTLAKMNFDNLVLAFFLKAASFLGYRPELANCVTCRKPLPKLHRENKEKLLRTKFVFDIAKGGILCASCRTKSTAGSLLIYNQLAYLQALLYLPLKRSLNLNPQPELRNLIIQYLKHHFEKINRSAFSINQTVSVPKASN